MDRYEQISVVGEGSYGLVMKCRHKDSDQIVAVKKFLETEEDAGVRRMALREIRMLKKLKHENLVTMIEVFRHHKRFYLVFEFLDGTVLDELERNPGGLGDEQCRERIFQVLRAIQYCHTNQIIHRDVKPENVLVSSLGVVKLCDFGFARLVGVNGEPCTEYVATRWYRAPELLVGEQQYGCPVDVWAIGCLYAEMMTGDPLFPGESDIDQMYLIVKLIGKPCPRHQQAMTKSSQLRGLIRSAATDTSGLYREFPAWSLFSLEFLAATMRMDPTTRPTALELLAHNYFTHDRFPARFLPAIRERVNTEFNTCPLLRRFRSEVLMSTDKQDDVILKQQQARRASQQSGGTESFVPRWRFSLGAESVKRKYSSGEITSNMSQPRSDVMSGKIGTKLSFVRREPLQFLKTNRSNQGGEDYRVGDVGKQSEENSLSVQLEASSVQEAEQSSSLLEDKKQSKQFSETLSNESNNNSNAEIQKLERSLESLQRLTARSNSANQQDDSLLSQPIKAPNSPSQQFRSLPPNQPESSSSSLEKSSLHPSVQNISFNHPKPANKVSPRTSMLQTISLTKGLTHTQLGQLPVQPRTSQLFLKRLDRNVVVEQQQQQQGFGGGQDSNGNVGSSWVWGNNHNGIHSRKKDGYYVNSYTSGNGRMKMLDNFSLPILPGATASPKKSKMKPMIPNSLTSHTITPRIQSSTSQKSANSKLQNNLPQM